MKVILVGYGRAGSIHAKAYRFLGDTCCLVGVVETSVKRHHIVKRECRGVGIFLSLEEAVSATGNDVVIDLCVPAPQNIGMVKTAIDLGVSRFMLEKPLGWSLDMSTVLSELLQGTDAHYQDTYQFSTGVQMLSDWISRQQGNIKTISIEFNKNRVEDSLCGRGFYQGVYPDAWHIEGPHMVTLALNFAGDIHTIEESTLHDMRCTDGILLNHGGAEAVVIHENGIKTSFSMDLNSEKNERFINIIMDNDVRFQLSLPISNNDQHMSHIVKLEKDHVVDSVSIEDRPMEQSVYKSIDAFLAQKNNVDTILHGVKINSILDKLVGVSMTRTHNPPGI